MIKVVKSRVFTYRGKEYRITETSDGKRTLTRYARDGRFVVKRPSEGLAAEARATLAAERR